jgi:glycosyltransferase 2 family protein
MQVGWAGNLLAETDGATVEADGGLEVEADGPTVEADAESPGASAGPPESAGEVRWRRLILNLVAGLAVAAVVIVIAGSRLGPQITHTDLGGAQPGYLALAAVCLIVVLLTEAFTLVLVARSLCPSASVWGVFGVAFESLLVGGATSFGGLEIPYQVVRLRHSGLTVSQATSAVIVKGLLHTSLLVVVAAVALVPAIGTRLTHAQRWIIIAVILAVIAGWIIAALWTRKPMGMGLLPRRVRKYTSSFREANLVLLRSGWKTIAGTVALQAVYWLAMFSIIPLVLMALGYTGGMLHVIVAQAALQVIMPFSPLPGGAGVAELGYLGLIGATVPSDIRVSSLLLWRIFTWLVPVVLGALTIGIRVVFANRKARGKEIAHGETI